MSKKKYRSKPIVQKIKEDPVWQKRAVIIFKQNQFLGYVIETMTKELERVYREVQ